MVSVRKLYVVTVVVALSAVLRAAPAFAGAPSAPLAPAKVLERLDREIDHRGEYIAARQQIIDSLTSMSKAAPDNLLLLEKLAALYTSFDNDSAISVLDVACRKAVVSGQDSLAMRFRISRMALLPLAGFTAEAVEEYETISADSLSPSLRLHFLNSGRQMFSFMSSYFQRFPRACRHYGDLSLSAQRALLDILPPGTPDHALNQGEYFYLTGEYTHSEAVLRDLVELLPETDNRYARACHMLADISRVKNRDDDVTVYLALSAISDMVGATREVTSLQELGRLMFDKGDIERAHDYLYTALRNAVECNAGTRMIQVSESVPLIESVHQVELAAGRRRIYIVIGLMAVVLLMLAIVLVVLRMKMLQMRRLQDHLREANATKEEYISQFLNLSSIYMDKLKQFCSIANRKISTGKVDELYQLTKSGRFVENQSKEFYEIFDNAFIHIYPGFVEAVNSLLRPDQQIELPPGELLNTDLRILAFMRLGINDTARIARILNYSVNTIYAYRNRLKARAINRDTFESDVLSL